MKKSTLALSMLLAGAASAAEPVNVNNFLRAESDFMLHATMKTFGAELGQLRHIRNPVPLDKQPVIRMNRDTLYSGAVLDLSEPATITLPEIGDRYQSLQVVNQDHYTFAHSKPGTYTLTQEQVGSRYALVIIRTLVDANDEADIKKTNAAQDGIIVDTPIVGGYPQTPDWDREQLAEIRSALNTISKAGFESTAAFGTKDEVDPIEHLVGGAAGWGALPARNAMYRIASVEDVSGETPYSITVKDVPVNAFWSITVYNKEGYMEPTAERTNFNSITADKNEDGSITINFGACEDGRVNCLPTSEGWNYTVRMYEPQQALIDGEWVFPETQPVEN